MLRFQVYHNGALAEQVDLQGAHLLGGDGIPMRSEMQFANGEPAIVLYGPSRVSLPVSGATLTLTQETRYPFEEKERVSLDEGGSPASVMRNECAPVSSLDLYSYSVHLRNLLSFRYRFLR